MRNWTPFPPTCGAASFISLACSEQFGPQAVREPYVKPLGNKLWEMRMKGRDGISRAVYVATVGKRLVVLHAFIKKTAKTPRAALETAMRRAKEADLI